MSIRGAFVKYVLQKKVYIKLYGERHHCQATVF